MTVENQIVIPLSLIANLMAILSQRMSKEIKFKLYRVYILGWVGKRVGCPRYMTPLLVLHLREPFSASSDNPF